jgi:hypothetical protein
VSGGERPPLGSWRRVYALVLLLAFATMLLLAWVTAIWHVPLPR